VGSCHFLVAALAATWPAISPSTLLDATALGVVFFVGSVFFTAAAWLQWLESLNGDVAMAFAGDERRWRWLGWRPRNLGYLSSAIQLLGTILFNFNTADAMLTGLTWVEQDVLIWTPNMLGSLCFLAASTLAWVELSHGRGSFAPRSIAWWIVVINLTGSVAFQLSALDSFVGAAPSPRKNLLGSTLWTAVGALCFLVGAYLLIPELFDQAEERVTDGF